MSSFLDNLVLTASIIFILVMFSGTAWANDSFTVSENEDWSEGEFNATTVDKPSSFGDLELGYTNGSNSDDVQAFWRLDGDSDDFSGNGIDSTDTRGFSHGPGILNSQSGEFSTAQETYVEYPESPELNQESFTVSSWIYMEVEQEDESPIVQKSTAGNRGFEFLVDNFFGTDRLALFVYSDAEGTQRFRTDAEVPKDEWVHVAATFDEGDGEAFLYINGEEESLTTDDSPATIDLDDNDLLLGASSTFSGGDYFDGRIDNVRLIDGVKDYIDEEYLFGIEGDYVSEVFSTGGALNWDRLNVEGSVPDETELNVTVEVSDDFDDGVDDSNEFIDVDQDLLNEELDLEAHEKARVVFEGSSSDPGESWSVDSFKLDYKEPDAISVDTQPEDTAQGRSINGPPTALVEDSSGDPVAGVDVDVSILGTSFDSGDTTVSTDENGLAAFDGLSVDETGSYELEFEVSEDSSISTTSDTFDIVETDLVWESDTDWEAFEARNNIQIQGDGVDAEAVFTVDEIESFDTTGQQSWDVPDNVDSVDVLAVGGGGGGAANSDFSSAGGGAGGAGGLVFAEDYDVSGQSSITVEVGEGGDGIDDAGTPADDGGDSVFGDLTAIGGGGGILTGGGDDTPGNDGGSGGGSRQTDGSFGDALQPGTNQDAEDRGNRGGWNEDDAGGAGGGGAGESAPQITGVDGGPGGDGLSEVTVNGDMFNFADLFGTEFGEEEAGDIYFAGGGGGGGGDNSGGTTGSGGLGGGGDGASDTNNVLPEDGLANTGGGGGGGASGSNLGAHTGGDGGSGIVLIRYEQPEEEGFLLTDTRSTGDDIKPNLDDLSYNLDGADITVEVTGSPETVDEETVSQSLDGNEEYGLDWNQAHDEFRLNVTYDRTGNTDANPSVDRVVLDNREPEDIAVDTQPKDSTAGEILETNPVAEVTDKFDQGVEGVPVTVSVNGTDFDSGDTTISTDENGLAEFDDLVIEQAEIYELDFNISSRTASSDTFEVSPADASDLEVIVQPEDTIVDQDITGPPTVQVKDTFGNDVEQNGFSIDVELDDPFIELDGTTNELTDTDGIGEFDDLSVGSEGIYQLEFSADDPDIEGTDSQEFVVGESVLEVQQQPTDTEAGQQISTIEILAEDDDGAIEDEDLEVTLVGEQDLDGGTFVQNTGTDGVAEFDDLVIEDSGTKELRFEVQDNETRFTFSDPFEIEASEPDSLEVTVQPEDTAENSAIRGPPTALVEDEFQNPVPKEDVDVSIIGTTFSSGTTQRETDEEGRVEFTDLLADETGSYELEFEVTADSSVSATSQTFEILETSVLWELDTDWEAALENENIDIEGTDADAEAVLSEDTVDSFEDPGSFSWDVPDNVDAVDLLVVGGGGGGGTAGDFSNAGAGGGGAGGLVFADGYDVSGQSSITGEVGDGGDPGDPDGNNFGEDGEDSVFDGLRALGGGGGVGGNDFGSDGGSGGGSRGESTGGDGLQPGENTGVEEFGNEGGGAPDDSGDPAGGGGGAGEPGGDGVAASDGGPGGDGLSEVTVNGDMFNFADLFGTEFGEEEAGDIYFAGGGGGGRDSDLDDAAGGAAGLGGGGTGYDGVAAEDADPNTGGGGGGGTDSGEAPLERQGGEGGSGVVLVSYEVEEGRLLTDQRTSGTEIRPNFKNLSYDQDGGNITVDVIGSPDTSDEEVIEVDLDGTNEFGLDWNESHKDFQLDIEYERFNGEDPSVDSLRLEAREADDVSVDTQPEDSLSGQEIEGPPTALVEDEFGQPVENVTVEVTLNDSTVSIDGDTTVTTDEDGEAAFDDLVIDEVGAYELSFDAAGVSQNADTDEFQVDSESDLQVNDIRVDDSEGLVEGQDTDITVEVEQLGDQELKDVELELVAEEYTSNENWNQYFEETIEIDFDGQEVKEPQFTVQPEIGPNRLTAEVDPDDEVVEENTDNNIEKKAVDVSSYQVFFGGTEVVTRLGSDPGRFSEWSREDPGGNIYFIDSDADFNSGDLEVLDSSEVSDADVSLGIGHHNDSLEDEWLDGSGNFEETRSFDSVSGGVGVVDSSDGTDDFVTGILYQDESGSGDFDQDGDPLVFITEVVSGGSGAVCVSCDYEVRVPADLQVQFDGATESIDIFNELE